MAIEIGSGKSLSTIRWGNTNIDPSNIYVYENSTYPTPNIFNIDKDPVWVFSRIFTNYTDYSWGIWIDPEIGYALNLFGYYMTGTRSFEGVIEGYKYSVNLSVPGLNSTYSDGCIRSLFISSPSAGTIIKTFDTPVISRDIYGVKSTDIAIGTEFIGSGLNDVYVYTSYLGSKKIYYELTIESNIGGVEYFKYRTSSNDTTYGEWSNSILLDGFINISIENDTCVVFTSYTGHTVGDTWKFVVKSSRRFFDKFSSIFIYGYTPQLFSPNNVYQVGLLISSTKMES